MINDLGFVFTRFREAEITKLVDVKFHSISTQFRTFSLEIYEIYTNLSMKRNGRCEGSMNHLMCLHQLI